MKQISLRLPDDLHARLKVVAEREHRSLHGQIVALLDHATRRPGDHAIPPPPEDGGPLAHD